MDRALKRFLGILFARRYIGGKHIPEKRLLTRVRNLLTKEEWKEFQKGYTEIINEIFILRMKKRTGKGSEWHISLNPRKTEELKEKMEEEEKWR
ncbi:MAG TPA: hypothetical protein VJG90_05320 [Candidatus Nanoarchaeia archaeon]|nr:hypothetical protein [Candidatus Nanoarchaeia archaeon]